jgi:hypothetical protein
MNPLDIRKAEMVSSSFAPFLEGVCKRRKRQGFHAVFMPKLSDEIHQFDIDMAGLCTLLIKEHIRSRKHLVLFFK